MPTNSQIKKLLTDPLAEISPEAEKKLSSQKQYKKEWEFIVKQRQTDNALQHYFATLRSELNSVTKNQNYHIEKHNDEYNYTFARKTKGRLVNTFFQKTVLLPAAAVLFLVISSGLTLFYIPFGTDKQSGTLSLATKTRSFEQEKEKTSSTLNTIPGSNLQSRSLNKSVKSVKKQGETKSHPEKRLEKSETLYAALPKFAEDVEMRDESSDKAEKLAMEIPSSARSAELPPPKEVPDPPSAKTLRSGNEPSGEITPIQKNELTKKANELWEKWLKNPKDLETKAKLRSLLKKIGDTKRLKKLDSVSKR